jgi:hypothetical protein
MRVQSEGLTQTRMVDETGSPLQGKARQNQALILPKKRFSIATRYDPSTWSCLFLLKWSSTLPWLASRDTIFVHVLSKDGYGFPLGGPTHWHNMVKGAIGRSSRYPLAHWIDSN